MSSPQIAGSSGDIIHQWTEAPANTQMDRRTYGHLFCIIYSCMVWRSWTHFLGSILKLPDAEGGVTLDRTPGVEPLSASVTYVRKLYDG